MPNPSTLAAEGKVAYLADSATLRQLTISRLERLQRVVNEAIDRIHQGKAEMHEPDHAHKLLVELERALEDVAVLMWRIT